MNIKNMKTDSFAQLIKGKKILVTGGTGSIGSVIVKQLLSYDPKVIRILSRDPNKQNKFQATLGESKKMRYLLGDIRDADRVTMACEDVDIIFHAAAFKYVPQGEYNPFEAVQTNVIGTQNLITAALRTSSVSHVIMISTDKAVEPANTMGASKLLAERLISATQYMKGKRKIVFATVRFGNVLGTSGSVLTLFEEQIKKGNLVVTHPDMVRFFMTISDAVNLVFKATQLAIGGEIFVLKMPVVAIKDLAEVYAKRNSSKPVKITFSGIRPGEKINESLLSEGEASNALETDELFIVPPRVEGYDVSAKGYTYPGAKTLTSTTYKTENASKLSHKEINDLLDRVK